MQRKVKWGIISTARIAETFARDIRHCANAELCAVASRSQKSADAFAKRLDIPQAFGRYESLLNDPTIDAIYVATPHTLHADHAIMALKSNKHVLCEKPATTSEAELQRILQVAKSQQRFFMEAMWTYFLPAIKTAFEWVDSGRIGKPLHLKASFGFPMPYSPDCREYAVELGGGCLLDMGIYPIAFDALLNRTETEPQLIHASRAPNGVDDDVLWFHRYDDVVSTLHTSFRSRLGNEALIIGDKGLVRIPDFWSASECYLFDANGQQDYFQDNRTGSGFEFEIEHASQAILNNRIESDIVSHAVSLGFQRRLAAVKAQFSSIR
ncbi:Gfo/Idh/MocA family protein [Aestuariibacter sp. A3R04]|uniref:Gfo/Idh/MocA family protein n=1 Tax=Aestuariibacter sp. A3R04 TaxID=2841571 RepID=UPI001C09210D|nr:Gfo/Idh/MocA family oxidoreductase [Aestuariibacter sp. A3R04]MBU3020709.1 Gfo/Idh/MocA family oxidoreductase [Aestuariibacter sp. A3R04]